MPGAVERGDVAGETRPEPGGEARLGVGRVVEREVAMELVVRLPADDVRVAREMLRQDAGDAAAVGAENRAEVRGVLPRAVLHGAAVGIDAQHLGVLHGEPARRRGGGRAKNGANAGRAETGDGLVEKREIEAAFLGLEHVPDEFAEADDIPAGGAQERRVGGADSGVPVFRVVGGAVEKLAQRGGAQVRKRGGGKGGDRGGGGHGRGWERGWDCWM